MQTKKNENGFSVIEVLFAILIMTVGILAALSAISFAVVRERESEQRNTARQINSSTSESVFSVRDMIAANNFFNVVANTTTATPNGVFLPGWRPIRPDSGRDGIHGTADDACSVGTNCPGQAGYVNTSTVIEGFERQITITNIVEENVPTVKRKRVDISVRYFAGQVQRVETISTIIANLPFN